MRDIFSSMTEFIEAVLAANLLFIMVLICTSTFISASYFLKKLECQQKAEIMGFDYQLGLLEGCMIETDEGRWIPIENYRY